MSYKCGRTHTHTVLRNNFREKLLVAQMHHKKVILAIASQKTYFFQKKLICTVEFEIGGGTGNG